MNHNTTCTIDNNTDNDSGCLDSDNSYTSYVIVMLIAVRITLVVIVVVLLIAV